LSPASHLILSLGQSERVFSRGELERLRAIGGLVTALVRRHGAIAFADREAPPAEGSMLHRQVTHVFNNFGRNLLTAREREVAVLVLRGYSLKAAAAALGIAFGTIKVHSKNLYAKLGIASQSELFSLFIEVMARAESLAAEDPLEAYRRSLRSG
jgi:DNA-binding CsgD family transcriptional regulator